MSIDSSLRSTNSLERHRNVLTRTERITLLKEQEQWTEGASPLGLPKVPHRKVKTRKKVKKQEEATEATPST